MEKHTIDRSIFRAYDIRGIVDEGLTESTVYSLGQVLGSLVLEKGQKSMVVGRDGRLSSPRLAASLISGIQRSGCDVINIGMVPTPVLYYATFVLKTHSGVMVTGSHNPANYNGLKMTLMNKALSEEDIQNLYHRAVSQNYLEGEGECHSLDMIERYIEHVAHIVKLSKPLKIVVDAGNGMGGELGPALFRRLGCEVHELHCDIDGRFPNHHPDPSDPKNLQDLIKAVKDKKADVGLAFDGDADRLGVVTKEGEIIWPDRLMMLFAKAILSKKPNAKFIYDVKCSHHLGKVIKEYGGEPLMWKTGHSLIKTKLLETHAALAGEMSGHFFFKDRWYGFDDALYSGARLLEILSSESDITAAFKALPDSINTPELRITVTEAEKFSLMQQLLHQASFDDAEIVTIDGLRVNFKDGWGLVRSSNTTPCLILRFEAESEKILKRIQDVFRELLLSVNPSMVLPF